MAREVVQLCLGDTVIAYLVKAHGGCLEAKGLKWLCYQSFNKITCANAQGQMGLVVRAGPRIAKVGHVVNSRLADCAAVKARCKGITCAVFHGKWCGGGDNFLLKLILIGSRLDMESH